MSRPLLRLAPVRARRLACRLAFVALAAAGPAHAETLVLSLSSDTIPITSNFAGADLALFGAIERDGATVARAQDYDVVVTVRGPRGQVTVREKMPWGPLWLNLDQRKYIAIPALISVLSNRPLDAVATPAMLRKLTLGVDALVTPQGRRGELFDPDEPQFRAALIRQRREEGLFHDDPKAVTFLTPTLFRATVRLPGVAPLGRYDVDVTALSGGVALARASSAFTVLKGGFEQRVAVAAREHGWLYGLVTALMAMALGWLATVVFRRD
jgi:uncharacterized protein (TIGR02186 family)